MLGVLHPWKYLEQLLKTRDMTQEELCEVIDKPKSKLSLIIQWKANITSDRAIGLWHVFKNDKDIDDRWYDEERWMELQSKFDLAKSKKHASYDNEDVELRIHLNDIFPIKEMVKRGMIIREKSGAMLQEQIFSFFNVKSIKEILNIKASFKRSEWFEYNEKSMKIWLKVAEKCAKSQTLANYNREGLHKLMPNIKDYTVLWEQWVINIIKDLNQLWIAVVILKHFEKTRVDGASFWSDSHPIVVLSLRYERIDNFWFTLVHELSHVYLHEDRLKNGEWAIIEHSVGWNDEETSKIESEANNFTFNNLITHNLWDKVIWGSLNANRIEFLSDEANIHPAIIVGQLQRNKFLDYYQLSRIVSEKVLVPEICKYYS